MEFGKYLECQLKFEAILDNLHSLSSQQKDFPRPIAIISTYNDIDIIENILKRTAIHCDVYILDNWSTDGTWELIQELPDDIIIGKERFPTSGPDEYFELKKQLIRKEEIAMEFPERWIIHQDSDEITLTPFDDIAFSSIFNAVLIQGYNAVEIRLLNFKPIDDDFLCGDPYEWFKYFTYDTGQLHDKKASTQIKIWFQYSNKRVSLAETAGHKVQFEGLRVFPIKFPRLHYTIRSTIQKLKKQQERLKRVQKEQKILGWHHHLVPLFNMSHIESPTKLIKYNFNELYKIYSGWEVNPDPFDNPSSVTLNNLDTHNIIKQPFYQLLNNKIEKIIADKCRSLSSTQENSQLTL